MHREMGRALWCAGIALALRAEPAIACAVCFDQNAERRTAFLATTVVLSLLPLAMIGSLVWWLRQRWLATSAGDPGPGSEHDSGES